MTGSQSSNNLHALLASAAQPRSVLGRAGRARPSHAGPCSAEPLESRLLLASVSWDGGGDGASWSDPANWSGDRLPRPRDVVVIGADATVEVGGKGERVTVRRLQSEGSLTLNGGTLRTKGDMRIDGEINVLANTTLRAGKRFQLGAITESDGARLVLRGASLFVSESAHISGLSRFTASAPNELWFAGAATAPWITLNGGDTARTIITGLLDASNQRPRGNAGTIHVLGGEIYLHGASIDARGRFDGGNVRIGGDYSGRGELPRAERVYIDPHTIIRADSKRQGDGGAVVVWSDVRTIFDGRISASAGRLGGDGGLIESSSKGLLSVGSGLATAVALRGTGGTWLMDPYDILVSDAPDSNIVITPGDPTVFMATGIAANVGTASISAALNAGTSVVISTEGAGADAGDIFIADDITKTAGGEATLTFIADRHVFLTADITSTSGPLNLEINAQGTFDATVGQVNTGGGMLVVNVGSISLGVTASLSTADGDYLLHSQQSMTLLGALNFGEGFGTIESVSGDISADTSIEASGVQIRAYSGSVQVVWIDALAIIIDAGDDITLGSGGGIFRAAAYLEVHAGFDGTGTVSFGALVEVHATQVRLHAGDGVGGAAASATVDVLTNSPTFRGFAGGATAPDNFTLWQDAAISDGQIPGPASFGSLGMPENLFLQSDDSTLTITTPIKVLGVNLAVNAWGPVVLGAVGQTLQPATLTYENTPPSTILAGTLQTTVGGISFPSNIVLNSPMVSIVSPQMIEFVGTINGASTLSVNSPMLMDFVGAIGNNSPLVALNTSGGAARFYSNVTAGTINVNSAAVIFYTVTMTASVSGPIFESTLTINQSLDELHIRGVSPEFNGGPNSVSGPGYLGIAPVSAAATMEINGSFLTPASLEAIAPGFSLVDFGSALQDGPVLVQSATFRNPTRFQSRHASIVHGFLSFDEPGAGVSFLVSGAGSVIANGGIETRAGVIEVDAPYIVNTGTIYLNTTQFGGDQGADIRMRGQVLAGDGQFPTIQFRTGDLNELLLDGGIGTEPEPFDTMIVDGGAVARVSDDIWLGSNIDSYLEMGAPFEIAGDVQVWVAFATFLQGIRETNGPQMLTLIGGGDLAIHGTTEVGNLAVQYSDGTTSLLGDVIVGNTALFNTIIELGWQVTISAPDVNLVGAVGVNGLSLSIEADSLNIGGAISPGGADATLSIAARTPSHTVSINGIDEGLWLEAVELSRILDGFALLQFGSLSGTGTLSIGAVSFSDPVEFRMAGPGGSIEVSGVLTGTGDASFTFTGSGSTTMLEANITTESEPIVFNDAVLIAVPLVTLSTIGNESPGADIVFNGLVGSTGGEANSLQLQAGNGNIEFNGGVGIVPGDELGTLTTDAGGGVVLISGGYIATTLNQNWNRPITLLADTVLCGQTGFITINQPINAGAFDLTLKADDVNINATLSGSGNLKIAPFTLTRDVYINLSPLGGGALIIDQTEKTQIQDGWNNVTFGEEGGDAQMVVGGGDYSDPTEFVMSGMGGNSTVEVVQEVSGSGNGTIIIRGGGSTTHLFASIITQGNAITIFDRVILRTPLVTLDSTNGGAFPMGGKIEIHGDVDSQNAMGHSLLIDPGLDELELFGELGDGDGGLLGMFTTGPFGTAILRGGIIKTIGQQLYQGPVLVPTDLFLSTLGAPIVFEEEVTGDENLTIGEGSGETSFEDETSFESLTIEFGDTRTFNGPTTIGTLTVLGGIVNFNAAGKIGGGTLVSGTLSGSDVAYIDGEFEWQGGLVEGDGLLVIRPSGVFSFGGASERTLARDVQVEGVLLWTSGHLYLRDSVITILSNGTFDVRSSGTMLPETGSQGQVVNQGLIERTFPGAAAIVDLTLSNTGEIRIANGSLKVTPLSGTFTNDGALTLGPVGSLIVRGDYVHAATATLNILIAGTGVGQFGRLIVLGEAILDGHVATTFHDEYIPSAGDEYRFLQADSRTGTFATQSLAPPPAGLLANVAYDPDGARLVISAALFGDTDGDGSLTVHDIFMFLENWFNGDGDFDGDGETTVNDIFAFLTAWFAQ